MMHALQQYVNKETVLVVLFAAGVVFMLYFLCNLVRSSRKKNRP